jgi:hypothetical protein
MQRVWKKITIIITLFIFTCLTFLLLNSKSVEISRQDKIYLHRFLNDWNIHHSENQVHQNLETELNFISLIQDRVLTNITGEQIPHAYFGNVRFYYEKKQGICYDRAVLLEKILLLYNFSFRHVYIYFRGRQSPTATDFFKRNITSHAALEVKTKKGWMAVGTDANWLGVSDNGHLENYYDIRKELEATNGNPRWQKPMTIGAPLWKSLGYHFRIIYGIYSRHGDFFTGASQVNSTSLFTNKRHFLPDYNFKMLLYNL